MKHNDLSGLARLATPALDGRPSLPAGAGVVIGVGAGALFWIGLVALFW
ncbi:MAG: hypothetical protein ACK4LQ_05490 [Pararhodobacter sp.]